MALGGALLQFVRGYHGLPCIDGGRREDGACMPSFKRCIIGSVRRFCDPTMELKMVVDPHFSWLPDDLRVMQLVYLMSRYVLKIEQKNIRSENKHHVWRRHVEYSMLIGELLCSCTGGNSSFFNIHRRGIA